VGDCHQDNRDQNRLGLSLEPAHITPDRRLVRDELAEVR